MIVYTSLYSNNFANIMPIDFPSRILAIETGINTDDATATENDILTGKTAYVKGEKVTGTIQEKSSSDLTASGSSVSVPSGYYPSGATKSVGSTTQATPSISVSSSGLITASSTQSAGYVTSGTKSSTEQLTTQSGKTITPSSSEQTAVSSGRYTTGAIKVAAIPTATQATPTISVSSSGLITASANQSAGYVDSGTKSATKQLTTKSAETITPSTTSKTIASGTYLTGMQTIKGDSNLKSSNIISGISIFGVSGSASTSKTGKVTIVNNKSVPVHVMACQNNAIKEYNVARNSSSTEYLQCGVIILESSKYMFCNTSGNVAGPYIQAESTNGNMYFFGFVNGDGTITANNQ